MRTHRPVLLLVALVALGAGLACVGTRAREISAGLVKLRASELRACLGTAPFAETNRDGSETWAYTAALSERPSDITISRNSGPGTAFKRPQVEQGTPIERKAYESRPDPKQIAPGQCLFLFEVQGETVRAFRSAGRTSTNLNADLQCAIELDPCVAPVRERARAVGAGERATDERTSGERTTEGESPSRTEVP